MEKAIVLRAHGGPETLVLEPIEVGKPGNGELRIRQTYLGVNFHDIYVRSGLYKTLTLPGTPGIEGVGIVEEVGEGVSGFKVGERIGYVTRSYGCYATSRILPASIAVKLPASVDDLTVASTLLKGLTVEMLVRRVYQVKKDDWVLVQAAAGGVGQMLAQWAHHLGAKVIGTAGSAEKIELARRSDCDYVIAYAKEDVAEEVKRITNGRGVNVVYDGVGKDTFNGSLNSLASRGHLANFGQSSGNVEPVSMPSLAARSTTLSRPVIFQYVSERPLLEDMSSSLLQALSDGWLRTQKPTVFPLAEAAESHKLLESRKALGPVVLAV
jgi:NADPH2:quinone reductase